LPLVPQVNFRRKKKKLKAQLTNDPKLNNVATGTTSKKEKMKHNKLMNLSLMVEI
jgi:hypothetical protein